jgi:monovalent cation:H+ antiporter, CPA1 family
MAVVRAPSLCENAAMEVNETVTTVRLFVVLIGLTALIGLLVARTRAHVLPYSVALVVAGGIAGLIFPEVNATVTPELVLIVLLPGLVFEAAYHIDFHEFRGSFGGITVLAVPGVLVSAIVVALVLQAATGLPFELGFLVGAMVGATDPAAVIATFRRLPTPKKLDTLVEGESLVNDGTGLVAVVVALEFIKGNGSVPDAAMLFLTTMVISGLIGLVLGFVGSRVLALIDDRLIETTISLVAAYGTYLIADAFHQSGVIATLVAGVVIGNYGRRVGMTERTKRAVDEVWEFIGFLLTAVVFLLVGLAIPLSQLDDALPWIAWGIVGTIVGRAVVVYGLLGIPSRLIHRRSPELILPLSWLNVMFWAGLRGAVAVAVALALPLDVPQRALIQAIVFGIVIFTLLVQGTTIGSVVKRSGALLHDEEPGEGQAAAIAA